MAIDFPNTPVNGSTYTYLGVKYTYSKSGGDEGFWHVTTPGSVGIATPAEISAGVDDAKYITPQGLVGTPEWDKVVGLPEDHINWSETGAEDIHPDRYVKNDYILMEDQKPSGENGGTFTAGSWVTRIINTKLKDAANRCTLSANQFTLVAGTYRISALFGVEGVNRNKLKLWNVTDSIDVLIGHSNFNGNNVGYPAMVKGEFTIASTKVFEIQHRCSTTSSADGFGVSVSYGVNEVYSTVELWGKD